MHKSHLYNNTSQQLIYNNSLQEVKLYYSLFYPVVISKNKTNSL